MNINLKEVEAKYGIKPRIAENGAPLPDWAIGTAIDEDGEMFAYAEKPVFLDHVWRSDGAVISLGFVYLYGRDPSTTWMVPARRELGSILDSDTDEMPVEEILKTVGKPPTFEQIKQTVEGIRKQHLTDCDWLDDERSIYGDFIIKGISGEFYPCNPDIFAKTYEKAKP